DRYPAGRKPSHHRKLVGWRNLPRPMLHSADHVDAHVSAAVCPRERPWNAAREHCAASDICSRGSSRASTGHDGTCREADDPTSGYDPEAVSWKPRLDLVNQ